MSSDPPLVAVNLQGMPPVVQFVRLDGVSDNFWYSLELWLGARPTPSNQNCLLVPVDRFLAGRLWLQNHCQEYGVGLRIDSSIRDLLRRARDEQRFLNSRLEAPVVHETELGTIEQLSSPDTRFKRPLKQFQQRDVAQLLNIRHGANFSVPGAGKTAVTYAVYEIERLRNRVARLLVIAPMSAFEAWQVEASRCFISPPKIERFDGSIRWDTEVLLVNYQKLKDPYYQQLTNWALGAPTMIVLDEAHRMKRGRDGEWGRACLQLAHVAERRDILTGTPAPNSPRDFIALLDYLWPNHALAILPATALHSDPPPGSMELVSRVIDPLFVRTRKSELGLEPPLIHVELVEPDTLQADIYDALRNRYAGMFDLSRENRTMLAQMGEVTMYLLEAATNPSLLAGRTPDQGAIPFRYPSLAIPPGSDLAGLINRYHDHELPVKFKKVAIMIEANSNVGRKTLVWSNFIGNLFALELLLARFNPALIYGGVPTAEECVTPGVRTRESELSRFREDPDCKVLLANPAALGEGVSLHETCHDAIYLDRTFNAGQYLQSLDRIHRLGLPPDTKTHVTILLTNHSIDARVDERVAIKATRLAAMLDDPDLVMMALPDEENYGEAIEDLGDLETLFAHLNGDDE